MTLYWCHLRHLCITLINRLSLIRFAQKGHFFTFQALPLMLYCYEKSIPAKPINDYIDDSLRSTSALKSASTPQIDIRWHHLKSWSDLRVFSNRCPFQIFRSMANLLVRVRVRAYISDVIGRRLEKVRNSQRFENWTSIWEFEKGQMSVT